MSNLPRWFEFHIQLLVHIKAYIVYDEVDYGEKLISYHQY